VRPDDQRRDGDDAQRVGAPPVQPALPEGGAEGLRRHRSGRQRDERVGDHGAADHERDEVAPTLKLEAPARDPLHEHGGEQPLGAARHGECHAHLERAAGVQVCGEAPHPGRARERRP
jgi:hypothetical protein